MLVLITDSQKGGTLLQCVNVNSVTCQLQPAKQHSTCPACLLSVTQKNGLYFQWLGLEGIYIALYVPQITLMRLFPTQILFRHVAAYYKDQDCSIPVEGPEAQAQPHKWLP
jgi:hypothetical protein